MKEKLKIAVLGSNYLRIPPTKEYVPKGWSGAPEWNVYNVAESLVKRGHDVTLFASGNSKTSAKLESIRPLDSFTDPERGLERHPEQYELMLISRAYELANQGKFDIINSHVPARSGPFARLSKTPTAATIHSPLNRKDWIDYSLRDMPNSQKYISISNAQRKPMPHLDYVGTVYHGVPIKEYPFNYTKKDNLLFVGRITPEKGTDLVIKLATMTGNKLTILGSTPGEYEEYYEEKIKPFIDGKNIVYKGHLGKNEVLEEMSKSKAVLFPIRWEEPFGQVIMEAAASATPIIAYKRGAVEELVIQNKTGFIINPSGSEEKDLETMAQAIETIKKINPQDCRKHFEENFSLDKMGKSYEEIFYKILNK